MSVYAIAVFLHIVGSLGFFVALALEWIGVRGLRRAESTGQISEILRAGKSARRLGMISMVLIVGAAFYMTMVAGAWSGAAWTTVAVGGIVLMAVMVVLGGRRLRPIEQALRDGAPALSDLRPLAMHPLLWITIKARIGIALGIVFIMTVKPEMAVSLIAIGVGTVLGVAAAMPEVLGRMEVSQPQVAQR